VSGNALDPYLQSTAFLNFRHPAVQTFVARAIGEATTPLQQAVRLFYAVRDRIRYDPYRIRFDDASYQASAVIEAGYGWCVPKASLLAACARAVGIPAAIGLADVVNHLNTEKLRARMGGVDVFYDHGYVALLLEGQWVKAVPAFNIELCTRFGVSPTEFDGHGDALYQEFDAQGRRHMQYQADHGTWSDLPLDKVREDFRRFYPASLVSSSESEPSERFENDRPLSSNR
jgi:transglutaminase-like putative cysteine protease